MHINERPLYANCSIYLYELRESGSVFRRTASVRWVLKVEVEPVEVSLPHEVDARSYELGPVRRRPQHVRHLYHSEVPASDGKKSLCRRIAQFDVVKRRKPVGRQQTADMSLEKVHI